MENLTMNLPELKLFRRRLIPRECVALPNDLILRFDEDMLVTSWKTIRPKKNMDHGFSCYYFKEGYKISKFYRADGTLLYYYCDIISPYFDKNTNELTVTDLLVDVIIYPDGLVKVVDVEELAIALENGSLTIDLLKQALVTLDRLLNMIYEGNLSELVAPIEVFE